jgi:hypothetical protein
MRREWKDERRMAYGRAPRGPRRVPKALQDARNPDRDAHSLIGKVFKQNVLYLIVVNLPTNEEMQQGIAMLEQVVSEGRR